MAGQVSSSSFDVRICALGELTDETRRELAGFGEACDGTHLVLRGAVADQAALVGVLERLWRAGLHIRDVEVIPATHEQVSSLLPIAARLEFRGHVADLLDLVVTEPHTVEATAVTTLEVALRDDAEALFELVARLERLALDVHEVHVRPQRG